MSLCPTGLLLESQLLTWEPRLLGFTPTQQHRPQNSGFGSANENISSSQGPHRLFHQATTVNPSEGGKARQETIFATLKLNN